MDFSFSEEQEMLRKTARDFLEKECPKTLVREMEVDGKGYSPELWQKMAGLGWMELVFPNKYGGAGMTFLDLSVLLEEMGRACVPGPFLSTVVLGGLPLLDLGNEEQKQQYLPKIIKGEVIFTLALTEVSAKYNAVSTQVKATIDKDDYIINGTKLFVPDAHIADYLLCVARTSERVKPEDGITIFVVDAKSPGMSCTVLETIAKDKPCEVVFDHVRVPNENILGQLDRGWSDVQKAIDRAAVAKCCEMIGGAQQALEMTVDYVKERKQFGQLLGSFQSIQDRCAEMAVDLDTSRLITYEAVWKFSRDLPCAREASMAKAWTSDAYRRITSMCHQVVGGVAFMAEHDMPLYFRQARSAAVTFGDADFHRERIVKELGL